MGSSSQDCGPRRGGARARRSGVPRILGAALLLLAVLGPLPAQVEGAALEGRPISRIEFVGLRKLQPQAVQELMTSKVGDRFSRDVLDQDVKALVQKDVFAVIPSVRAVPDPQGTGVLITVTGDENRRVAGVVFLGIIGFDREELLPLIRTRAGGLVDDFTLELDRQELLRHYKGQGYHYAEVDFRKTTETFGDLIVFKVTEGVEVKIRDVVFEGNRSFSDGELLKQMPFTDTPGLLSSTAFVFDQVKRDVTQLERFYRARGFLDALVTLREWRADKAHEEVVVTIDVVEGAQYVVRSIAFDGVTLLDEALLREAMRTRVGGPYQPGFDLDRDRRDIREQYELRGYTRARVDDVSVVDLEGVEVDVILEVAEGELTLVGEIKVQGNVDTRDRIIRREIDLYTGEPLNLKKLQRGRSRVRSLGYWELTTGDRGVDVTSTRIPFQEYQIYRDVYPELRDTKSENIQDLVITVSEKDTGNLRFAAGVGSNSGLIGDITYSKQNFDPLDWPESFDDILDAFTGGGQFLTLSFQPGTVLTRWRASWGNPRVFDSVYGFVADVYRTAWIREDWDEDRIGYSLRVSRLFGEDLAVSLSLRDEVVDVEEIDDDAPQLVFDFQGENRTTALKLQLRLNRLDDFVDPTDGYLTTLVLEHAGLWGDIEFNKVILSGEHYTQVYEDESERVHVIRLKGSLGWAEEFGDSRDIPVFERFFLGGQGTVRGFLFRGIGPRDGDDPIGGKAVWTASAEYAFPLLGDQIRGVAFMDTGSAALDWSDGAIWDVRVGVGAGLRVVIPFLGERPVAIDFGFPLVKKDGDETQIVSFSFGSNF